MKIITPRACYGTREGGGLADVDGTDPAPLSLPFCALTLPAALTCGARRSRSGLSTGAAPEKSFRFALDIRNLLHSDKNMNWS